MNKSIALLIIGVISLAMFLIMINQFATTSTTPPLVGVQTPLPQTNLPSSTALSPPTSPAQSALAGQSLSPATGPATLPSMAAAPAGVSGSMSGTPATPQPYSPTAPNSPDVTTATTHAERPVSTTPAATAKATPPPSLKETPPPPPAAKAPAKTTGPKTINKITVSPAGDGASVRIAGNTTLAYKTMHLKSPDRVVVDLEGTWAVKAPGVPNNKAVKNVRIGKQGDKTRIVIDLSRTPGAVNFIKINAETMEVRVK